MKLEDVHAKTLIGTVEVHFTAEHFLAAVRQHAQRNCVLVNDRNGNVIADDVATAFDSASRRTGLLRHTSFPEGHALIIAPTNAIHMFFMKFAIDVAFFAKDGRVLKARAHLKPWRIAAAFGARGVVELPAGALARSDTREGDRLVVRRRD